MGFYIGQRKKVGNHYVGWYVGKKELGAFIIVYPFVWLIVNMFLLIWNMFKWIFIGIGLLFKLIFIGFWKLFILPYTIVKKIKNRNVEASE